MSCYRPLAAFSENGSRPKLVGRGRDVLVGSAGQSPNMELPCGHCIGCRQDKARAWSIRLNHEAQLYDSNLFVTLTYDEAHLPASKSLEYSDFQGFMRRVRKEVKGVSASPLGTKPIRFFVSGEYGERFGRPHWHTVLFNTYFRDQVQFVNGTYRSSQVERLWERGDVVIGSLTPASAAYVAGYTLNKLYGRQGAEHYEDVVNLRTGELTSRRPPFCVMSRRPGIGYWWFLKYGADLFPGDFAVQDGKKFKVPNYYWRFFQERNYGQVVEQISQGRYDRAREKPLEESSDERRAVREDVCKARMQLFHSRTL